MTLIAKKLISLILMEYIVPLPMSTVVFVTVRIKNGFIRHRFVSSKSLFEKIFYFQVVNTRPMKIRLDHRILNQLIL